MENYVQIVERVDEVFPQTTDFDYRTLTPELMWGKVKDLLEDIGILTRMSNEDAMYLQKYIMSEQRIVHDNTSAVLGKRDSETYDQNNYFLKYKILNMKNKVMKNIVKYGHFELAEALKDNIYDGTYDVEVHGSIDELEELTDRDNIAEYIGKLFSMTVESFDAYSNTSMTLDQIIMDIKYHYGLKEDDSYEFSSKIKKEFDKVVRSATKFIGNPQMIDGFMQYEGVEQIPGKFAESLPQAIKDIVDYISLITDKKIVRLKEREKKRAEVMRKSAEKNETIEDLEDSEYEMPIEVPSYDSVSESFSETRKKFNRLQEIMKEQGEIVKKIDATDATIAQIKNQLAKAEEEKRKLEAKYKANAIEMGKVL